jgi:hypothetical protein
MPSEIIKCSNNKCYRWSNSSVQHCKGIPYLISNVSECWSFKEDQNEKAKEEINNSISTLDLE